MIPRPLVLLLPLLVASCRSPVSVGRAQDEAPRDEGRARSSDVLLPRLPAPPRPLEFQQAKRALESQVYDAAHRVDVYCGCAYDERKRVDFDACSGAHPYVPEPREADRASRMEWEHVLPASWLGHAIGCWHGDGRGRGGRDVCRDEDPRFARAEGDMHNLLPSVGQLNAIRDDHAYGEVPGEHHLAGCDFELASRTIEPPDGVRGDLARATLYTAATYGVPLRPALYALLRRWHEADPPDAWERERNARIARIQGNRNPYVDGSESPPPISP